MLIKKRGKKSLEERGLCRGLIWRGRVPIVLEPGLGSSCQASESQLGGGKVSYLRIGNKNAKNHPC